MILSPSGDGINGIPPDVFGMSASTLGAILAGERLIFPDNNLNHSPAAPAFGFNVSLGRLYAHALLQMRHAKQFDSNDLGGVTFDASGSDDQHSVMTTSSTTAVAHVFFLPGSGNAFLLSANSHQLITDTMFRVPTLSDATNTHYARFGYANVPFGTTTHGAYFEFDANVSGTGSLITSAASVKTTVSTGITIVANTYYRMRLVATNNTRVDLYIAPEGTPLPSTPSCSSTTNIPSGTGQAIVPICGWERTAAAASAFRSIDYSYVLWGADRLAA